MALIIGLYLLYKDSDKDLLPVLSFIDFKSCPEQNAFPFPVITTARISTSFLAFFKASCSS
ncbi:MAG: Uncharacterised protein [Bacteroidetes bacterium MED-G17]|nr:MAG: Uncharacterised protein [Bacteroidetes bacterium MED-G17]